MLLQGLPLKEDMEENETVYKCITQLFTAKNPVVSGRASLKVIITYFDKLAWELRVSVKLKFFMCYRYL